MEAQLRRELKQRILDHSAEFKLDSILISSHVRQVTETMQVSAMDVAYALSTILEYPHHINQYNDDKIKPNRPVTSAKQDQKSLKTAQIALLEQQIQKDKALENLNNCLHDNFWTAFNSLETKNHPILTKGIELAIEMQQAIMRVGYSLIERHEIKVARCFRYVML